MRRVAWGSIVALVFASACARDVLPAVRPGGAAPIALAVAIDDEVLLVSADGASVRSVYRFAPPDIAATALVTSSVSVDVQGRHAIATRSVRAYDGTAAWQQGDRAVLLDGDGRVLWEKSFTAADLGPSHARAFTGSVGDGGNVVLTIGWQYVLVTADGGEQPLDGVRGAYAPLPGPVVPVIADTTAPVAFSFGWWRPGQPPDFIGHPLVTLLDVRPSGFESRFLFSSQDGAGARLLIDARPSGFEARPWPAEIGESITRFGAGAWQGDDHGGEVMRWNAVTGQLARLPWSLPAGMRLLGTPSFDADGSLIAVLRNDFMAGVHRSTAAGPDWVPIGATLGDVETVEVANAAGTYVVDTTGTNDWFVTEQTWQPAPAGMEPALRGRSHQIVRPVTGASLQATPDMWNIQLSPDGQRALYWEYAAPVRTLLIHDIATDSKRPIASRALPRAYQAAWAR
jgi:hypothetical protein